MKNKKSPGRKGTGRSSRSKDQTGELLNFFAEAGLLKRIKRSGWWVAGIENPESVAEHCFRTAVIGYALALLEGADPFRVVGMCLFNDIHEARINDLHKMGHRYIDFKQAEKKVFADQVRALDARIKTPLSAMRREYDGQESRESLIARDADILECLVQAKEYYDHGEEGAKHFFAKAPKYLKTAQARKVWQRVRTWKSSDWWQDIVKFER